MLNSRITRFLHVGAQHEMPDYLQKKLVPTNVIAYVLIFCIAIPFVGISLIYFPSLAILPALGGLTCGLVLIANYFGGIYYSRLFIAILPLLLGASYNAFLCGPKDDPISSVYLIELSFSLMPFVIFDRREKGYLAFTSILSATLILTFHQTKTWVSIEGDAEVLRHGWLSLVTIGLAILTGFGTITGLIYLAYQSEQEIEKQRKELDEKNKFLEETSRQQQENLQQLNESRLQDDRRNWATEGISLIAEILRKGDDAALIYDQVIAQVVNYLKANQGGLYVMHQRDERSDEKVIRLAACYAFSRKKFIDQEYEIGQGLLGQCYLEAERIHLTEVPDDYVRITSGLGEANARVLLIVPLKVNDTVEGLIELASFTPLEEHQIQFVERAGETIASFIQSNRINERTKQLLEASQQQAEEMRAQEEEMRQNMEELAATQEEMHRKESEYLRQIEALKNGTPLADTESFD